MDTVLFVWFSEKVEKYQSGIQGMGLRATQAISDGELLVVKGGHVFPREMRDDLAKKLGPSEIQIADHLFIGPVTAEERDDAMMYLNHSCDPNVGISGQILFLAMRDIDKGEELTFDYATGDDDDWTLDCNCGSPLCRYIVTGQDWRKPELQHRYHGWFSTYLEQKIRSLG